MGNNCGCLRTEDESSDILTDTKHKRYESDYSKTQASLLAKSGNKFQMFDDEEKQEEIKPQKIVVQDKHHQAEEVIVADDRVYFEEKPASAEPIQLEETNKPVVLGEEEDEVVFVSGDKKANIIDKQEKKDAASNQVRNQKQIEETIKQSKPNVHEVEIKKEAVIEVKEELNEDDEDNEFDCPRHSKSIFNYLNGFKSHPHNLIGKLENFSIPSKSKATEEDLKSVISSLKALDKKGKAYLWNEKGYITLRSLYQKRVDGENLEEKIQDLFNFNGVNKVVEFNAVVHGKFEPEETAILLILENSKNINGVFNESSTFCSVCSVQGSLKSSKGKFLTSFAFAKSN